MSGFEHRLMSRPLRLHWAGWTADTYSLQRAGWSITAEQDIARMTMQLGLRHPNEGGYGVSSRVPFDYMYERDSFAPLDLGADIRFGRSIDFHVTELPNFRAVDAMPQMMSGSVSALRTSLTSTAHWFVPTRSWCRRRASRN